MIGQQQNEQNQMQVNSQQNNDGDDDMRSSSSSNFGDQWPDQKESISKIMSLSYFTKVLFVYESVDRWKKEMGQNDYYLGMNREQWQRQGLQRRQLFMLNMRIIFDELVCYFRSLQQLQEYLDQNCFRDGQQKLFISQCESNPGMKPRPIYIIVIKTDEFDLRKLKIMQILGRKQVYRKFLFFNPDQLDVEEVSFLINAKQIYGIKNIIANVEQQFKKNMDEQKYQQFYSQINIQIGVSQQVQQKVLQKLQQQVQQQVQQQIQQQQIVNTILGLQYQKQIQKDYEINILTTNRIKNKIERKSQIFNIVTKNRNQIISSVKQSHVIIITTDNHTIFLGQLFKQICDINYVHLILWGENESDFQYQQMTTVENLQQLQEELKNIENKIRYFSK